MEGGQWLQPLVFVDGTWEHGWKWTPLRELRLSEKASKMTIGNLRLGRSGLDSTVPFFPSVRVSQDCRSFWWSWQQARDAGTHVYPLPVKWLWRRRKRGRRERRRKKGEVEGWPWGKYTLVRKWLLESIPESKFLTTGNLIQGGDGRTSKLKSVTRPIEARGILKAGRPSPREVRVAHAH